VNVELTPRLIDLVRSDTPDGFELFYMLIQEEAGAQGLLPKHARKWIEAAYDARDKKKGLLVEAFRGSTKTTTFMAFLAYRIGLEPHRANLVVQVGDDIASVLHP